MELLTTKEAACLLKLKTPDKVCLLIRSNLIRGFKLGRQYLIDKDSVLRYCESQLGYLPSHKSNRVKNSDTLLKSSHYI